MSCSISNTCDYSQYSDFEIKENFLNTFQLLSEKQKKIWEVFRWFSTHYRQVFISHDMIAEKVGCHRTTVIEALKKFSKFGWIGWIKRCYRSNLYFMKEYLMRLDTRKNETFAINPTEKPTVIPTENPTLYTTYSNLENVHSTSRKPETEIVQDLKSEKEHILQEKIGIRDPKDIFCLSRFSLRAINLAYEDLKTRWYKSGPIRSLPAWITNRCKSYERMHRL